MFIVETVLVEALDFLSQIDLSQLTGIGWFPRRGIFDVTTLLLGTLIVTAIAMVIATPIGLASAIYLAEYATPRVRKTVKPILEVLAGIPSVVLGFFALTVITPDFIQQLFSDASVFNLAAAGHRRRHPVGAAGRVGLRGRDARGADEPARGVVRARREEDHDLAPDRVSRRHLGHRRRPDPRDQPGHRRDDGRGGRRRARRRARTVNPLDPGGTMTSAMVQLATGSDQVTGNSAAFQSLFFIGLLLFIITLVLNVIGDAFVRRARQRY